MRCKSDCLYVAQNNFDLRHALENSVEQSRAILRPSKSSTLNCFTRIRDQPVRVCIPDGVNRNVHSGICPVPVSCQRSLPLSIKTSMAPHVKYVANTCPRMRLCVCWLSHVCHTYGCVCVCIFCWLHCRGTRAWPNWLLLWPAADRAGWYLRNCAAHSANHVKYLLKRCTLCKSGNINGYMFYRLSAFTEYYTNHNNMAQASQ